MADAPSGFAARVGWDPVSGLGSVDYPRFSALLRTYERSAYCDGSTLNLAWHQTLRERLALDFGFADWSCDHGVGEFLGRIRRGNFVAATRDVGDGRHGRCRLRFRFWFIYYFFYNFLNIENIWIRN